MFLACTSGCSFAKGKRYDTEAAPPVRICKMIFGRHSSLVASVDVVHYSMHPLTKGIPLVAKNIKVRREHWSTCIGGCLLRPCLGLTEHRHLPSRSSGFWVMGMTLNVIAIHQLKYCIVHGTNVCRMRLHASVYLHLEGMGLSSGGGRSSSSRQESFSNFTMMVRHEV
jgi:hypothetical protein